MRPAVPSALRVTANGHRWHRAAPTAGEGAPSQAGVSWPGLKPHPTETFRSHSRGDTVSGRSPFRSGKPECLLPHFHPSAGAPARGDVPRHCRFLPSSWLSPLAVPTSLPAPAGPPGEGLRLLAFTSGAFVDFRFSATASVLTAVASPEPLQPARSTAAASVDTAGLCSETLCHHYRVGEEQRLLSGESAPEN